MRHGKKFNHLGRTAAHRRAMLANMASSLIEHKRINTTLAKAKALKQYVEPLITKSKDDTTHSRRVVFSYLQNKQAVSELFREVADKVGDRPGGYTRIIKTGNRLGDNAEMCMIELVDFNELYTNEKETAKSKTRRSRRGGGGAAKKEEPKAAPVAEEKEQVKTEAASPEADTAPAEPVEAEPAKEKESSSAKGSEDKEPKAEAKEEAPAKEESKAEAAKEEVAEEKAEETKAEKEDESTDDEEKKG